jgi:hypothetical protein
MDHPREIRAPHRQARHTSGTGGVILVCLVMLAGCGGLTDRTGGTERLYRESLRLGQPLRIGLVPFRTGGFPANEQCMEGNYTHPYRITSGLRAGDVWLCCVPVNELLRESFACADGILAISLYGYGSPEDLKVQYCSLYDAQSTELRYTPACIPAPLMVEP